MWVESEDGRSFRFVNDEVRAFVWSLGGDEWAWEVRRGSEYERGVVSSSGFGMMAVEACIQ